MEALLHTPSLRAGAPRDGGSSGAELDERSFLAGRGCAREGVCTARKSVYECRGLWVLAAELQAALVWCSKVRLWMHS